jgi:enterochelin esterase-like enzyme
VLDMPPLPHSLAYRVYLPPCYRAGAKARFPTLYLLHGLTATDAQWDDLGADEVADTLIAGGQAPPFLIVMPYEQTGMDMEQAVVDVLMPAIERVYATGGTRELRAIGGLSRGGGWAMRIGLKHPDLFSAIGMHSPAILSPDLFIAWSWTRSIPLGETPRIWIDVGQDDTHRPDVEELTRVLTDLSTPFVWHLYPGEHTAAYWSTHLPDYLLWYTAPWREASAPAPTPSPLP